MLKVQSSKQILNSKTPSSKALCRLSVAIGVRGSELLLNFELASRRAIPPEKSEEPFDSAEVARITDTSAPDCRPGLESTGWPARHRRVGDRTAIHLATRS